MTAGRLWLALSFYWVAAACTLAWERPPLAAWPVGAAAPAGALAGLALFVVMSAGPVRRPPTLLALVLVLTAVAEELVWRGVVFGSLEGRAGPLLALMASSLLFGAAHAVGRRLHTATGLCFGALYLATGGLAASCCAHAVYNVACAGAAR